MLSRPTVNLNGYNASLFENLESCIVYLYSSNRKYRSHDVRQEVSIGHGIH